MRFNDYFKTPAEPLHERPVTDKEYRELSRLDGEMVWTERGPHARATHPSPSKEARRRGLERQLDVFGRA